MERVLNVPEWFQKLLDDPSVTDLCVNGTLAPSFDRGQGMETLISKNWNEADLKRWVLEQLSLCGKTWDARQPFVDFNLRSGHRAHAIFPPLSRAGLCVSIRKLGRREQARFLAKTWEKDSFYAALREAVVQGESVLIAGATGSGKTTLLNALLSTVPTHERILALKDTPELEPEHAQFVSLLSRAANADGFGEVSLRSLLRQTLRMRPDRIVLGECRGDEVLDLLQVLNTGHRGAMATLHAHSARDALRRLELLCLLGARGSIPVGVIRELISSGLRWIAQVAKTPEGRRIVELCRVEGKEGDVIVLRPWPASVTLKEECLNPIRKPTPPLNEKAASRFWGS